MSQYHTVFVSQKSKDFHPIRPSLKHNGTSCSTEKILSDKVSQSQNISALLTRRF